MEREHRSVMSIPVCDILWMYRKRGGSGSEVIELTEIFDDSFLHFSQPRLKVFIFVLSVFSN